MGRASKTPLRWASIAQVGSSIWTLFLHCKAGARSTTTYHGVILYRVNIGLGHPHFMAHVRYASQASSGPYLLQDP